MVNALLSALSIEHIRSTSVPGLAANPHLVHLRPPNSAGRLWLERFSPLFIQRLGAQTAIEAVEEAVTEFHRRGLVFRDGSLVLALALPAGPTR